MTPAAPKDRPILRLGHSPDPDDAFMWWPLSDPAGAEAFGPSPFQFQPVLHDIQTLNRMARSGDASGSGSGGEELEITALSCAAWPAVRDRYVLTACGSSLGDGFGPKLVSRTPMRIEDLRRDDVTLAIPGRETSAFAAASLLLGVGTFRYKEVPFDRIIDLVEDGTYPAGLVIHEGQLTFPERGLHLIEDLGAWWTNRTGFPLPLGVNAIRRDLDQLHGPGTVAQVAGLLARSVQVALANRAQALTYAMRYSRTPSREIADRFVSIYVNRWTLDFGPTGRGAVEKFLDEIAKAGLAPHHGQLDLVNADA